MRHPRGARDVIGGATQSSQKFTVTAFLGAATCGSGRILTLNSIISTSKLVHVCKGHTAVKIEPIECGVMATASSKRYMYLSCSFIIGVEVLSGCRPPGTRGVRQFLKFLIRPLTSVRFEGSCTISISNYMAVGLVLQRSSSNRPPLFLPAELFRLVHRQRRAPPTLRPVRHRQIDCVADWCRCPAHRCPRLFRNRSNASGPY